MPRQKVSEPAGGRVDQRLDAEEAARWKALREHLGGEGYGADKRTLLACMAAAEDAKRFDPTNAELAIFLREAADRLTKPQRGRKV